MWGSPSDTAAGSRCTRGRRGPCTRPMRPARAARRRVRQRSPVSSYRGAEPRVAEDERPVPVERLATEELADDHERDRQAEIDGEEDDRHLAILRAPARVPIQVRGEDHEDDHETGEGDTGHDRREALEELL